MVVGRLQAHPIVTESYKRRVVMQNQKPVVVTASVLVCAEAEKILGVKVVAFDTHLRHESGIFFLADQTAWPALPDAKKSNQDFRTRYSILPLLKDFGLDYIMNNCITIEADEHFKDMTTIRLNPTADQVPSSHHSQKRTLEMFEPATQERIMSQLPPNTTTLTPLERYLDYDQALGLKNLNILKQKSSTLNGE